MTKAQATKEARAALKLMPAGWKINVWLSDVSSYHYEWCLAYAGGLISVYRTSFEPYQYQARADMTHPYTASYENWGGSCRYDNPQHAVENILERIHMKIAKLNNFLPTVSDAIGMQSSKLAVGHD